MSRPYSHNNNAELRKLFLSRPDDVALLHELLAELTHRRTPSARSLRAEIQSRIGEIVGGSDRGRPRSGRAAREQSEAAEHRVVDETTGNAPKHHGRDERDHAALGRTGELFGSETEAYGPLPDDRGRPAQLTLIRPPGTTGLPSAYVRPFKREVALPHAADADLPDIFIGALHELIREMKKSGTGQKRYELEKGRRIEAAGGETLYKFPFADEADLFEDARVEVRVEGQRIDGTIVRIDAGHLILGLKEDIGSEVTSAVLVVDATALLEALKEKIEAVKKSEMTLNRGLADATVGRGEWPARPADPIPANGGNDLNESQHRAYKNALENSLTFIWGPPGCGKTKTLAEIVRSAFEGEKKTLVCSNTNKAVDQVLYNVCKALGTDHPAMVNGRVVRLGRVADDKLESEYRQYVTVDGIVERRSGDLQTKKIELGRKIAEIDARIEPARQCLAQFESLDRAEHQVAKERENFHQLSHQEKALRDELTHNTKQHDVLAKELQRRRTAVFTFFRRSENAIRADMRHNSAERGRIQARITELAGRLAESRQRFEQARRVHDRRQADVAGKDRKSAQAIVDMAEKKRAALISELRDVEAQIAGIRDSVLREARIVGTTCTKVYLSQKDIGQVDLVIIDEASMVILPVAWFAAGQARERVVISGDFRQIPPIVATDQGAIFDTLGRDPFAAAGLTKPDHPRLMVLDTQYRMSREICELIAEPMYGNRLKTYPGREPIFGRAPPAPFEKTLTIIDTSDLWPFESRDAFFSRFNMMHALLTRNLAWHLKQSGVIEDNRDLGICTPYAAQARMIRKLLEGEGLDRFVQAGTVHRYQGDERRIVLLEIPESHGGPWPPLGQFVQGAPPDHVGARLINVAITRAQQHLVVLANLTYLDKHLPSLSLLRGILHKMQQRGHVLPGREVLKLRPIENDLDGLVGKIAFDELVKTMGIFDEKQFERGLAHDIRTAKYSIVLFSGYITLARVGKLGDLLRSRILDGVKVRCVTRPPRRNGSIPEAAGREAVKMLEGIGAVVDLRAKIHQKVCLIDNRIVWWGSLNALSHMGHADETMTRVVNEGFAAMVAHHMSKRPISAAKALSAVTARENPVCGDCGAHTVYDEGRHGPFFYCEAECGWRRSMKRQTQQALFQQSPPTESREPGEFPRNGPPCPDCGAKTLLKQGRYGLFYSCSRYPACKGIAKMPERARSRKAANGTPNSKRP